ncbi:type III PLP-dependent enzyme [Micromonospora sp. KC606]|uniref:type III PLP-dependent enzyme n=1 Tax=Micromonospora sp. KC606 TaxID=2530379 RepID=UPI001051402E|nr:type III PLP-dependent enzyme [Micromonospora sp. KC606]TDC80164.1 type III PLP-dependent enzyme [Micromonospora sp. KC606]
MTGVDELAERFGTPLYVYDLDRVAEARDRLFAALPGGFDLFYAVKANPHPEVAGALRDGSGPACRAEISSTGELDAALAAGYAAGECLYTGPGKTDTELAVAIARGVRLFSAESPTDLRRIGAVAERHGAVAECLLRINCTSAGAATGIRMMGRPSQFGLDLESLPALMPELRATRGARLVGAHFFTMSNAGDESDLLAEFERVVELAAGLAVDPGLPLELLDLGGGFAAPYAVPGAPVRYPKLRAELERLLDLHLPRWRTGTPRLACESGRYLVAGCGTLLCGVVNVKRGRGQTYVIVDAGINAIGGLSGLGRLLPMAVCLDGVGATEQASLVGPLCTPGDLLGRDVQVPVLAAGDLVRIPNVGAYGITASLLGFLSRPAPAEVTVRNGAVVSVSRLEPRRVPLSKGAPS